jgi:hypothetical protein
MGQNSLLVRLLQAERERYILVLTELESRLQHVRNQIISVEALISGYAQEEQMYQSQMHFTEFSEQALHEEELDETELEEDEELVEQSSDDIDQPLTSSDEPIEPDISDIPKLSTPRKPDSVPMLSEFQQYSVQNAILILMRYRPEHHFNIDVVVRDLYGDELTKEQYQVAKRNVGRALSSGVQMGFWYRVLRVTGVYTLCYKKGVTTEPLSERAS